MSLDNKHMLATHVAFYLATGEVPRNACHVCQNPACVRPSHLFDGSTADNMYDRALMEKGAIITACATATFIDDDELHPDNPQMEQEDKAALDALMARARPTAGQPNLGTEEHEQC
jgi:hypothetical protein